MCKIEKIRIEEKSKYLEQQCKELQQQTKTVHEDFDQKLTEK